MKNGLLLFFLILTIVIVNVPAICGAHRSYEPIVLSADSLNFFQGLPVERLFLFSYNSQKESWKVVPFQIDEIDTSVKSEEKYFGNNDGLFNASDELVFLTNSLGDQAPAEKWVAGADTVRLELNFFDPLNQKSGYVYLYYSPEQSYSVPNPYEMSYHADTDQIETLHYLAGFNNTGQLGDVAIKNASGGSGEDIFDRVKIRFYLSFFTLFLAVDEDSIIFDHAYAKAGPVRVIRNVAANFVYRPLFSGEQFTQTSFFYPWHGEFKLVDIPVGELTGFPFVEIDEFRLSWDMNSNAAGMKLFSAKNQSGVTIDGDQAADSFNPACFSDQLNWTLANGDQGSLLNIFYVPAFGDSIRLYYHDATDGSTGDYQPLFSYDTGDQMSYGDNGFSLIGNLEFYITPQTTFQFLYYNFFLGKNFTPDSAAILTEYLSTPLGFSAAQQKIVTTNVENSRNSSKIEVFELRQNYPNPFNSTTTIQFLLPSASSVKLFIYDVSGRNLKRLAEGNFSGGLHSLSWNGTNQIGRALPSGVYFYKLITDFGTEARKLLLIK
ncbi:MAG: T9SS type A sorting domain-containing protein [Calditrichaeota bacterium]|nr:T9SS type A sorting domain-containing protein [Calditrichota bacterium]